MGIHLEHPAASARDAPLSGRPAAAALAALAASAACFVTVESLPIGLLPQIAAGMHASLSATGLLVTIYAFFVVGATVPLTHLTRHLPRRRLLACAAAVLTLGCLGCVAAPDYGALLAARILTASAQAVFWAVGPLEATNLVRAEWRGRAVTAVFGGSAGGLVLGIPIGTALGHAAGWRLAFAALAAAGGVLLVAILAALPQRASNTAHAGPGEAADRGRYRLVLAGACLAVTGFFAAYTYANPFLVRVGGLPRGAVALALLGGGLMSTVGLSSGGLLYARHPRRALAGGTALMVCALLGLSGLGTVTAVAVVLLAFTGLGQSLMTVSGQLAVIDLGPSNGTAWYSTAYNVGIASGPLAGAGALQLWGLRATPLVGATVAAVGCVLLNRAGSRAAP